MSMILAKENTNRNPRDEASLFLQIKKSIHERQCVSCEVYYERKQDVKCEDEFSRVSKLKVDLEGDAREEIPLRGL